MRPIVPAGLVACAGLAALAACGGGNSGSGIADAAPVGSASLALRSFMQAAADSNLARMAQLWGTAAGPASMTGEPSGWEKRVIVMQAYLRGDSTRLISDTPVSGEDNQRRVIVALYRTGCVKQIPATVIRGKGGGWLVFDIDVQSAGNPARPCESGNEPLETLTR
jgi:hypothetical protein